MQSKWLNNQRKILINTIGWNIFTLCLLYAVSFYLYFYGFFKNVDIKGNKEIIDYIIRFMIFEIPASITIFSFVYKEQKEASYSNTKISNTWMLFIYTISFSIISLFFSVYTISVNPIKIKDVIENKNHFMVSLILSIFSFALFLFFIINLLRNMDIRHSFKKTFEKTEMFHKLLKKIYSQKDKKLIFDYQHIVNDYAHLIESNFQLLLSSMKKNNLSDIQTELKKIYSLSQDFYQYFINVESINDLSVFLSVDKESFIFSKNKGKTSFNNKENLTEIYNNILLNYKLLIRECSKLGMTRIQKQAYTEFTALNPIMFYNYNFEDLSKADFDNIFEYYVELTEHYHTSLYELLNELSDEGTVEYSYLLEKIASTSSFFKDVTTIDSDAGERQKYFNESLILKNLTLLEAITVSAIESNNIKFLTESTNILLRFYYTQVPFPTSQTDSIRKLLRGEDQVNFLDKFINEDLKSETKITDHYFKSLIVKSIIRIIIHSLHKSIELGHYQCTGYLTKISCSHITIKNFIESIVDYTNKIIDREIISYDFDYYYYSINNFSKVHCIQKMILILGFQIIYKYGDSNADLLSATIKKIFAESDEDIDYMIEKVIEAKNSYGMIAISTDQKKIFTDIIKDKVSV